MDMGRYTNTAVFLSVLALASVVLSIQLPFAYYSADNVFHAAKIMAAANGEYTVDPVTGLRTIYPPLFHTIFGFIAGFLGLSSFQTTRVVQLVNFAGLHLGVWLLAGVVLRSREKGALAALLTSLLVYAPTGKYIFFQNPFNFSVPFCLAGAAMLVHFHHTDRLRWGLLGAFAFGFGVNVWWWNVLPLGGALLGLFYIQGRRAGYKTALRRLGAIGGVAASTLLYSAGVLYSIRDTLPYYDYDMAGEGWSAQHTTIQAVGAWLGGFLLRGNQPFFKHLVPAALSSGSRVVLLYGIVASVHYYLIVLPFSFLVVVFGARRAFAGLRSGRAEAPFILGVAAAVTIVGSVVTLYYTDPSVLRRVQFHCFLLLLPLLFLFAYEKFAGRWRRGFDRIIMLLGAGVMLFTVVYRFSPDLYNPLPAPTQKIVKWIRELPDHARVRIFTSGYDALILEREVRFRSFILDDYRPLYFRMDKPRSDSVFKAYRAIVACGDEVDSALRTFDTRYAIIGKVSVNISPVVTKITENELSAPMLACFDERANLIFQNDYWAVYDLAPIYEVSRSNRSGD